MTMTIDASSQRISDDALIDYARRNNIQFPAWTPDRIQRIDTDRKAREAYARTIRIHVARKRAYVLLNPAEEPATISKQADIPRAT